MDLEELLSLLDQSTIRLTRKSLLPYDFTGALVLEGPHYSFVHDNETVYFIRATDFNELAESEIEEGTFFILRDAPLKPTSKRATIAEFTDQDEWYAAFRIIGDEFRLLDQTKSKLIDLARLVNEGASPKALVNMVAEMMGAPASILDNSLAFIAYSDNFPHYAAKGKESPHGFIPDDALPLLREKGILNPKEPDKIVIFDWHDDEGNSYTNHLAYLHSKDIIFGSVSLFTHSTKLRRSRIALLPSVAQILSLEIQKSSTHLLNKSMYSAYLFSQIEEGSASQLSNSIRERLSAFGYHVKPYVHLVLVDFSGEYTTATEASYLVDRVSPFINNNFYVIKESCIMFLTTCDEILERGNCDIEGLERALSDSPVKVGISSVYLDIARTAPYIQEARRAIAMGHRLHPEKAVYPFADYRLFDLIRSVPDQALLYSARFPPLVHVIDLDRHNGTELAYTLYRYLQDPTHPDEVAAQLFIHKNTLYYRLNKIREIMGTDFKDAETIACLQMTFHVLEYQNRFDRLIRHKERDDA